MRRGFAGVQNAFASCAGALQGCKMLSQSGKRLYKGAKCFPGLGNDFTRVQNAFPIWETTLQGCKMLSQRGKRLYKDEKCFPNMGSHITKKTNGTKK